MQFTPPSRHFIPLWSKYSPQHPVLKHPQFMFLTEMKTCRRTLREISFDHIRIKGVRRQCSFEEKLE
jgi:hypothetical protein